MKALTRYKVCGVVLATLTAMFVFGIVTAIGSDTSDGETAGNNLSYPVIWAEGVTKALPGEVDMDPKLEGEWWYWWGIEGTDPNIIPLSCPPDPENPSLCDDGMPSQATGLPPGDGWLKVYLQKDELNVWQAGTANGNGSGALVVDWIDWGDNLESVDWYTRSQVRTEVVLFKELDSPMVEYEMRHLSGWGTDEVHGIAVDTSGVMEGPGTQATIYSPCARLTIQKLQVDRDDAKLADLVWVAGEGWTEAEGVVENLVNEPLFNKAVHEAEDGPGYYNAELNVKGRIIYGYTWNVRKLNDGPGVYRITFSFDGSCGEGVVLNTLFEEGTTQITVPAEEEESVAVLAEESDGTGGGGTAVLDYTNNLTYIDVRILERASGGKGGKEK